MTEIKDTSASLQRTMPENFSFYSVTHIIPENFSDNSHKHLCVFVDVASLTPGNISEGIVEVDVAFKRHISGSCFLLWLVLVQSVELQQSHEVMVLKLNWN